MNVTNVKADWIRTCMPRDTYILTWLSTAALKVAVISLLVIVTRNILSKIKTLCMDFFSLLQKITHGKYSLLPLFRIPETEDERSIITSPGLYSR